MSQRILTFCRSVRWIQDHEDSSYPASGEEKFDISFTISGKDPNPILGTNPKGYQSSCDQFASVIQLSKRQPRTGPWYHYSISMWEFVGLFFKKLTHGQVEQCWFRWPVDQ